MELTFNRKNTTNNYRNNIENNICFLSRNHCQYGSINVHSTDVYLKGLASYLFYLYYCLRVNRVYAEIFLPVTIFKEAVHSDDS